MRPSQSGSLSYYFVSLTLSFLSCLPIKDELSHANHRNSKSGTPQSKSNSSVSCQSATAKAIGHSASSYSNTPLSSHDGVKLMSTESASATPLSAASDVNVETKDTPTHDQDILDELNTNLDRNSDKPESNNTITAVQEVHQSHFGHCDGQCCSVSIIISVMNSMLFKYSVLFAFWIYFVFLSR